MVWFSPGSFSTSNQGVILGQRYASEGSTVGGEFLVNSSTTWSHSWPSVALDSSGGFVAVWNSGGSTGTDSDDLSIQAQRFGSDGSEVGSEFQVNTYTLDDQFNPVVSPLGSQGFVVVWVSDRSSGSDSHGTSIQAQVFNSDGSILGSQFQVNTLTTSNQVSPAIESLGSGDFVVSWNQPVPADPSEVRAQRFSSIGSAVGNEFRVNTNTTGYRYHSSISSIGSNRFVVVWGGDGGSGTDTQYSSIQGQLIAFPEIFDDGFESGDTTAWSATIP